MRCYLISEPPADLTGIRSVLADLGVGIVEPAHAFDGATSESRQGWLPGVDFVCAVFPVDRGWETPPSVYLEIGEAVGAGVPVMLVAEPPRRLDAGLFPLPVARVPLTSKNALATHLSVFIASFGRSREKEAIPTASVKVADLKFLSEELAELRLRSNASGSGEAAQSLATNFEDIALRLLRAAGAEAEPTIDSDDVGDIAAWVPGTERFIPGPLVVELKILRNGRLERDTLERLKNYALSRDSPWSLLLYFNMDQSRAVRMPKAGNWPMVIVLDIEELAQDLRQMPLAKILNNARNSIVHGQGLR